MSIAIQWAADGVAPVAEAKSRPGLFQRVIEARGKAAMRRLQLLLAAQSDQHLTSLGFTSQEIAAMRQGHFRFPAR